MPLPLLVGIILVGLILVAGAVLGTFGTARATLGDDVAIAAAWTREHPDDSVCDIRCADDRRAALIVTSNGTVGLIRIMGDKTATQIVTGPPTIIDTGSGLRITLTDYAAPHILVPLSDVDARRQWRDILDNPGQQI